MTHYFPKFAETIGAPRAAKFYLDRAAAQSHPQSQDRFPGPPGEAFVGLPL